MSTQLPRHFKFENEPLSLKFKLISDKIKKTRNSELDKYGLTFSQFGILFYLAGNSGKGHKVFQKELGEAVRVKPSTMTGLIGRMEEKGLVRQTVDDANSKFRNIEMTAKAVALLDKYKEELQASEEHLVSGLSREEAAELGRMLDSVYYSFFSNAPGGSMSGGAEC